MKQSSKHLAAILTASVSMTACAYLLFHYKLHENLLQVDLLWLKVVLSLICGLLFFLAVMEVYHFYFYPTARRILLRTISLVAGVGFCGATGPWIASTLRFLNSSKKDGDGLQIVFNFDKAGQQSTFIVVSSLITILVLVYWYIALLKWERRRNGEILA